MHRLTLLLKALALTAALASCGEREASAPEASANNTPPSAAAPAPVAEFDVVEASIPALHAALLAGDVSARQLVATYLERIDRYDSLNAAIAVSPTALARADALDRELAEGRVRGPLHGIPIALKDNIHTTDMPTTGGALAFAGFTPPYPATLVEKLEAAGAIIIAKTTLTELANWVATGMPNGYNALTGFSFNPYDPRPDPRGGADGRGVLDTGGSSSGVGTAANLWAANIGTETSGSIQIPATQSNLVAIKPTVGRVSRHGIIPITADQDTAGPMAKTVAGAAILLAAMEGEDSNDPATGACPGLGDPAPLLDVESLEGARIGIPRAFYYEAVTPPGTDAPRGGLAEDERAAMALAIGVLREAGAVIVDPANLPSVVAENPADNQLLFGNCYDYVNARGKDGDCSVVMKYGMKRDFNNWLASLGDAAPVATLADLRAFNSAHADDGAINYGQAELDISDEMDVDADRARYTADRAKDLRLAREEGIDAALASHNLDALLFPSWHSENILNKAGYPAVVVPFTTVANQLDPPAPKGFEPAPRPFGVSFVGTACSEPALIGFAHAFEQLTRARTSPPLFP